MLTGHTVNVFVRQLAGRAETQAIEEIRFADGHIDRRLLRTCRTPQEARAAFPFAKVVPPLALRPVGGARC